MSHDKPVVLVVDDVPANIDVLHGVLRDDYKVKVATDGARALQLAQAEPKPDLILLDIMMPGMDGYEVCERLKEDEATASIPVIFVTAMAEDEDEQKGLALGAVDYVTKPFNPDTVLRRVQSHLALARENRTLARENRAMRAQLAKSFTDHSEERLAEALGGGRSETREFLECLGTSPERTDDPSLSALRCVSGFLNASGGTIFVGVSEQGEFLGWESSPFESDDALILHWVNLLIRHLGAPMAPSVRTMVRRFGDRKLLVIECIPAVRPAFLMDGEDERFFVRTGTDTRRLRAAEAIPYIERHFSERAVENPQGPENDQPTTLWEELSKRRVLRTAVIYVATAWGFTEAGTAVADALKAPEWVTQLLVLLFVTGFPIAVILSWLYDIQVKRTEPVQGSRRRRLWTVFGWLVLISLLAGASYYAIIPAL